jgi:predicted dehydrogenase
MHLTAALTDPRCKVVALSDINLAAAEAMNTEHKLGAAVFTDHRQMLRQIKPDIVVTCLWTPLHLPVFRDCAEAGVRAVLSEKPMAPTWGECLEMARLADETPCQLTFSHQRRFAEGNQLVRKLIHEGRFGKILRMDLYATQNVLDCGTHTFDQALSFNDESPARWAMGAIDTSKFIKWFDVSAENMATGLVMFDNGVPATFQIGVPERDMHTGVRVIGDEGFIEADWDGKLGQAVVYNDPAWKPEILPTVDIPAQMIGMFRDTVDSLDNGVEPELSHRKALRATEILFAIYESVRQNRRIELPVQSRDNAFLTMLQNGEFEPRPIA